MRRSYHSAANSWSGASDGSAEQPAVWKSQRLKDRSSEAAGAPKIPSDQHMKLQTSVGYISFPSKGYTTQEERREVIDAVRESKQGNIKIINMVFARDADIDVMWNDLNAEMKSKSSVEQPAFSYRINGNLMTLFSEECGFVSETNIDTEDDVPAICLTSDGPAGKMSTINACLAGLPQTARKRLLAAYLSESSEQSNCIHLIGGALGPPMLLENFLCSLDLDYNVSFSGDICVLAKTSDGTSECFCFPVDYSTAHGLATHLWHKQASAPDSDARPVRLTPRDCTPRASHEASDSDAHPALFTLKPLTPLWDKFVLKLDLAASTGHGRQLMKFIEEQCFCGDLCYKNANGDDLKTPMPLALKMECLLQTTAERRRRVLERLRDSAAQPVVDSTHEIEENDMIKMWQRGSPERGTLPTGVMGSRSGHKNRP